MVSGPETDALNKARGGTTMRHTKVRVLVTAPTLALLFVLGTAGSAGAHGERAQEGFLRMKTIAWQDVKFSSASVKQGEQLIITGTVKVLESWPTTLEKPEQAFLNVSASGPHFVMKERYINGQPAPGSIFVHTGGVYEFKMVLEGRTTGYWHVHPTFYVLHTGGLLGPGQWTTVDPVPGGYQNKVQLASGQTIDLDTYGSKWVFWFSFLGFIPGVWWMLWWTLKHRTVTNLAVTSQIPLNDPGEDIGLITKADHRTSTLIVVVSVILLIAGWLYMDRAWPTRIPQQVLRITPPALAEPVTFAQAKGVGATYDPKTDTLVLESQVTNTGARPMKLVGFTTSNLTFSEGTGLVAEPTTVEPGGTATLKLSIQDDVWSRDRLIPLDKPQMGVAGLLVFESGGKQNAVTVEAPVKPTSFQ
jgi:methane/ammonia monooxygenase subunit B